MTTCFRWAPFKYLTLPIIFMITEIIIGSISVRNNINNWAAWTSFGFCIVILIINISYIEYNTKLHILYINAAFMLIIIALFIISLDKAINH